jgi:hypothetical protein
VLVVSSRVCKWSTNPFTNPNPVYSHTPKPWQYEGIYLVYVHTNGAVIWGLTPCSSETSRLLLISCLAYSSSKKMENIRSSETSGSLRTKWRHNPDDSTLHSHIPENLTTSMFMQFTLTIMNLMFIELTPWSGVLYRKVIVTQVVFFVGHSFNYRHHRYPPLIAILCQINSVDCSPSMSVLTTSSYLRLGP